MIGRVVFLLSIVFSTRTARADCPMSIDASYWRTPQVMTEIIQPTPSALPNWPSVRVSDAYIGVSGLANYYLVRITSLALALTTAPPEPTQPTVSKRALRRRRKL